MTRMVKPKIIFSALALAATLPGLAAPVVLLVPRAAHAQLVQALLGDNDDNQPATPAPAAPAAGAGTANAGTVWDEKQIERLDRNVHRADRAVNDIQTKGPPPALLEPDPEVLALQATTDSLSSKANDNAAAMTGLTGQLEDTQHQSQLLEQQVAALMKRTDDLVVRADATEAHLKTIDVALAPPPPPPPSEGSADSDFAQAMTFMTSGQTDEAERAFTAFTTAWPEATQVPEAWFHLGEIHMTKKESSDAVAAFATALKGWPKTPWAPEATVELAAALSDSNRPKEACLAMAKFDQSYDRMADAPVKTMATHLKAREDCQ